MTNNIFYLVIGLLLIFNIAVSVALFKRDDLGAFQKVSQGLFVWIVPILGGMLIYSLNTSHDVVLDSTGGSDGCGSFGDSPIDCSGGDGD